MLVALILPSGHIALFDDCDVDLISKYKWKVDIRPNGCVYVRATPGKTKIYMHRLVMGNPKGNIDHIDRNGLNNCRANLRICTQSQNGGNQAVRKKPGKTSRFKGVYWKPAMRERKWCAQIMKSRKHIYLGAFHDEEDAAHAYDYAAVKLFGQFARTNFPHP